MSRPLGPEQFKACCAAAYGADWLTLLLGESYHPGGFALTRTLTEHLDLPPGARVLDVASGRGASALAIAGKSDLRVCGVDLSEANVAAAREAATGAGLGVELVENHDAAIARMAEQIEARLLVFKMIAKSDAPAGVDLTEIASVAVEVKDAIARGLLGYTLIVATRSASLR